MTFVRLAILVLLLGVLVQLLEYSLGAEATLTIYHFLVCCFIGLLWNCKIKL